MFDIEATKRQLGITTKKVNSEQHATAIPTIRAIHDTENSQNSTSASLKTSSSAQRKACFWRYKTNPNLEGFIHMGLMTGDEVEAQKQLTKIYGKPVISLYKK